MGCVDTALEVGAPGVDVVWGVLVLVFEDEGAGFGAGWVREARREFWRRAAALCSLCWGMAVVSKCFLYVDVKIESRAYSALTLSSRASFFLAKSTFAISSFLIRSSCRPLERASSLVVVVSALTCAPRFSIMCISW